MTKTAIGDLVEALRAPSGQEGSAWHEPKATYATKPRALLDKIATALETLAAENVRLAGERDEARKPNRDAMLHRSEAQWDALQEATMCVYGLKAGHTLTADDEAALSLVDRCRRNDDEEATDAYHRGHNDGLRERGGGELVAAHARADEAFVQKATERALRRLAEVRADAAERRLAEIEAGVTREKVSKIARDFIRAQGFSGGWDHDGLATEILALISRPAPTEERKAP